MESPKHIPHHLQGTVKNFSREEDGTISFDDTRMGTRAKITPQQYDATFNPTYLKVRGTEEVTPMYGTDPTKVQGFSDTLVDVLGKLTRKGIDNIDTPLARGTAGAALAALATGAYGASRAADSGESKLAEGTKWGIGGAITAAGVGTLLHHALKNQRPTGAILNKTASSPRSIIDSLQRDQTMSFATRADIMRTIAGLNARDRGQLRTLLSTLSGPEIGIAIQKFLLNTGPLGLLAGPDSGGLLGHRSSFPSPMRANYGRMHMPLTPYNY